MAKHSESLRDMRFSNLRRAASDILGMACAFELLEGEDPQVKAAKETGRLIQREAREILETLQDIRRRERCRGVDPDALCRYCGFTRDEPNQDPFHPCEDHFDPDSYE